MRNIKDWNLKHKIILHITVIGAITAFFLTFLYIKTQRNIIHDMSHQKVHIIGSIIENSIYDSMKKGKLEEVQSTLQRLSSSNDINKIRIISPEGKILKSSKEQEIGSSLENDSLNKIKEIVPGKSRSNIAFLKQQSTIRGFRIIENKKECFACHPSSNKINGILEVNIDYSAASALLRNSQVQGSVIALIALAVLSLIIFRLFNKLINRPLSRMKDKMKKVQEGDLTIQFSSSKNDEIGSLAKSFNLMITKLREANQKIEELFNRQMERAEHLASLGEIAAGLAHEIKNPIAGMKGALEIFNQKTDASDPKKEIFTEMLLQIDKIDQIIQDLLSYAKPKEMSMSLVNANECIENAIKLAKPQIKDKEIHFEFQGLGNGAMAWMDAVKMQEVILNLILNSIYAINKKGAITIKLSQSLTKELEILLSDNGMGIKKDHLAQVFNPFFTTKSRGTGLGLSICKKIIEAHNGSVEIRSKEKKGTTFFIRIPVLQASESP